MCWQSEQVFLLGGASWLHVCLRNRTSMCLFRTAMAHAAIHGIMGCLTQTAEPGRNIEPEHFMCCFRALSPAVQQPMAVCQGAVFRRLFNKTPSDHGTTAAVPWSEGWARGTWPASPLSFPRVRNGSPSPIRGGEPHPAAPHSLLAEATSLARANPLLAEGRGARAWLHGEPLPTTVCGASAAWHLLAASLCMAEA